MYKEKLIIDAVKRKLSSYFVETLEEHTAIQMQYTDFGTHLCLDIKRNLNPCGCTYRPNRYELMHTFFAVPETDSRR